MTKITLDLISDVDMYLCFEKGMGSGISYVSKKYIKAKNKYFSSYGSKHLRNLLPTWTKIIYMAALSQNLFQWADLSGWILQNLVKINALITV